MKKTIALSGSILAIAFLVGCGQKPNDQAQPNVAAPSVQTPVQPNQNYIKVKELGFKIPVSADIANDTIYSIEKLPFPNDGVSSDKATLSQVVSLSSKKLNAVNKKCESGIFSIIKIPGTIAEVTKNSALLAQDYKNNPEDFKQMDGFFLILEKYAVVDAQYSCSGNIASEKKFAENFYDGFKNIEANEPNQSANTIPADWKTYINKKLGFSFSYPGNWFIIEDPNSKVIGIQNYDKRYTPETAPKDFKSFMITYDQDQISSHSDLVLNQTSSVNGISVRTNGDILAKWTINNTKFLTLLGFPCEKGKCSDYQMYSDLIQKIIKTLKQIQ